MQTSMANYMHYASATDAYAKTDEEATAAGTKTSTESDDIIPDTPDSQEDLIIGDTRSGNDAGDNDLPIQIGQWLQSFQGSEVGVVANGHCAFLAMHATSANYSGSDMKNTAVVVAETTEFKWFVYSLMMNNLRKDVQLNLIDPIKECASLHPDQPLFTSVQGATAALYAHYDAARKRSAGAKVQKSYWAGPHELRAMAQYLREPILVFDVSSTGDAHVQRYCYGTHRLADGTDHESGYGTAMKDRDATEYLRNCWRLHVLPTFIILRHHERHFYGVSHGELYFRWRAEGDPGFTSDIAAAYDWKTYINVLTDQERGVDMATINRLADRDDVNDIIIKRLDMRVRLDVVHARMGFPILDKDGIEADWTVLLEAEEKALHEDYGLDHYSAGSQSTDTNDESCAGFPQRYTPPATGELVMNTYFRTLRAGVDAPMEEVDMPLANLIVTANAEGFRRWCTMYHTLFNIPELKRRTTIEDLRPWLLQRTDALRHLFAFLPYPEQEAKTWTLEHLEEWGASEVYLEQLGALRRIVQDTQTKAKAKTFCTEWLAAVEDKHVNKETAYMLARAPDRWKRLAQWLPPRYCRAQPQQLTEQVWRILHVIPYTVAAWTDTPMGRAHTGARATWYDTFPFVRSLCHGIVDHNDWSSATEAPTGQAWGETAEEISAGLPTPEQN